MPLKVYPSLIEVRTMVFLRLLTEALQTVHQGGEGGEGVLTEEEAGAVEMVVVVQQSRSNAGGTCVNDV